MAKLGHSRFPAQIGVILADYPCDLHLARYHGPSNRIYVNAYREELEFKLKMSVCGDCLAVTLADWAARALVQNPQGIWDPMEGDLDVEALWRPTGASPARSNGHRRP